MKGIDVRGGVNNPATIAAAAAAARIMALHPTSIPNLPKNIATLPPTNKAQNEIPSTNGIVKPPAIIAKNLPEQQTQVQMKQQQEQQQHLDLLPPPPRPKVTKLKKVSDYIFIKQIGSGSFSTVHLANHFESAKKVAIKMIPNNSKISTVNYARIQSEIKILLSLNHKNIVKILDLKKTPQNKYLIFEFCGNGDLESYIKKHYGGSLSEQLAQQVMMQVCDAFKLLSKHKIVHRDLKLANILVDDDFVIKIADFGFAKLNSENDLLHSTLGTPITMAPEILFGKNYNEKCDIWSLGVIIYQMVFGKAPFMPVRGGGIPGLMKEIQKETFEFPESKPISNALKQLLLHMLKIDPAERIGFPELFAHEWITGKAQLIPAEMASSLHDFESDLTKSLQHMKQIHAGGGVSGGRESMTNRNKGNAPQTGTGIDEVSEQNEMTIFEENEEDNLDFDLDEDDNDADQDLLEDFLQENSDNSRVGGGGGLVPNSVKKSQKQQSSRKTSEDIRVALKDVKTNEVIDNNRGAKLNERIYTEKLQAGVIKIALSLRKYLEKRISQFISNCDAYLSLIANVRMMQFFSENEQIRLAILLSCMLTASRIKSYLSGGMSVRVESNSFPLGSYADFSSYFSDQRIASATTAPADPTIKQQTLQTGTINDIVKQLEVRFSDLQAILREMRPLSMSTQFATHSPEYLFLQATIQSISYHQAIKGNKGKDEVIRFLRELYRFNECLLLPSLQLKTELCNSDQETKDMFTKGINFISIMQSVLSSERKAVRFSQFPYLIKVSLDSQVYSVQTNENNRQNTINETLFRQLQKTFIALLQNPNSYPPSQLNTIQEIEVSEVIAE